MIDTPTRQRTSPDKTILSKQQSAESAALLCFEPERDAYALRQGEKAIVFSDMHYGVRGRQYIAGRGKPYYTEKDMQQMVCCAVDKAEHLVFNGDNFEMVYHEKGDKAKILHHFGHIIDEWVEVAQQKADTGKGQCRLHIVLGNHDDDADLFAMLQEKAEAAPDVLSVHPVALRLGSALFIHGDVPLRQHLYPDMQPEERLLGRESFMGRKIVQHFPEKHTHLAREISASANAKMHYMVQQAAALFRQPAKVIDKLYNNLKDSPMMEEMQSVDGMELPRASDVITGHTHAPYLSQLSRLQQKDKPEIQFHNTGSPLEINRFCPLEVVAGEKQEIDIEMMDVTKIQPEALQEKAAKVKKASHCGEWQQGQSR